MNIDAQRKIAAILRILAEAGGPMGSTRIARALRASGIDLQGRMVRNYLEATDEQGLTVNLGRRGRRITDLGRRELARAVAFDKIGFIDARADELAFRMSLDLARRSGTIILNLSTIPASRLAGARDIIRTVMDAGLGMGRFWTLARAGAEVAGFRVPPAEVALGTVCAITFNGVLRAAGVPVVSRFGGLLELHDGRPARFTHLIRYDGTTLDPLEIFIKARMTSVRAAAETGNGVIGASFREVPAVALPLVEKTVEQFRRAGLGGLIAIGDPSRPLLDIPVSQDRAGVAIAAGLNPIAAVHESGIPTANHAMARLWRFEALEAINGEAAG